MKKQSNEKSIRSGAARKVLRAVAKTPALSGRNRQNNLRVVGSESIVHAIGRHSIELVLTDFDLTLSDAFWAYFIPTMESELPRIARTLRQSKLEIARRIGCAVNKFGTHEYPWLLEVALRPLFSGSCQDFEEQIVEPFWATMESNRKRYSRSYPTVVETLVALRNAGIPVAVVSDGPMYMVLSRAKETGLDGLVSGIYALDVLEPGAEEGLSEVCLEAGRNRVRLGMATEVQCPHTVLPNHFEKPSDGGARIAMADFGVRYGSRCLMVGDSLKKDGGLAWAIGAGFIWAPYGHYSISPRGRDLVDVMMNPEGCAAKAPNQAGGPILPTEYPPMLAAAPYFAAVLDHLGKEVAHSTGTILPPSAHATAVSTVGH